jgi:hypothetical protein
VRLKLPGIRGHCAHSQSPPASPASVTAPPLPGSPGGPRPVTKPTRTRLAGKPAPDGTATPVSIARHNAHGSDTQPCPHRSPAGQPTRLDVNGQPGKDLCPARSERSERPVAGIDAAAQADQAGKGRTAVQAPPPGRPWTLGAQGKPPRTQPEPRVRPRRPTARAPRPAPGQCRQAPLPLAVPRPSRRGRHRAQA